MPYCSCLVVYIVVEEWAACDEERPGFNSHSSLGKSPQEHHTMGRRKSNRKPPPRKKNIVPLDTMFNCPFCNHEKSCEVDIDHERNTARVGCRICMEDFQCTVHYLMEPVDVYNEWIDACEAANG
ncbi:Transcription elongation factor 1 [Trinorchestia longiramus]|nr:Transcription elongation factor 1 [Trinorchestia longiramus]